MISFEIDYKITKKDSLNTIYSGTHWSKRKKYKDEIKLTTRASLNRQLLKHGIFKKPVMIHIIYPFDNLDIDNHSFFSKCVIDTLKGILIADDDPKNVKSLMQSFDGRVNKICVNICEV